MTKKTDNNEEEFNKLFAPLRGLTPRTSLLSETLSRLPAPLIVTASSVRRFSYMDVARYSGAVVFATLILLFSPLLYPMNVADEVYAMEIEAEEIADAVEYDSLAVELEYDVSDLEVEMLQLDLLGA